MTDERMNANHETIARIYAELLRAGKADVTHLRVSDIIKIAATLGWDDEPKLEFVDNGHSQACYLKQPGWRPSRKKQTAGQEQLEPTDIPDELQHGDGGDLK